MMIIDGEKYACVSCVRGHRVSNCQHTDRPLQHINRKGRPVSQCDHCRSMRKSRSVHVRCDCGEKPNKCPHLMDYVDGHKQTCCCHHGARCTCGTQQEPELDTVPESDSDWESRKTKTGGSIRRRRANTLDGQRPKKNSPMSSLKPLQSKGGLSGVRSADNLVFPLPSNGKSLTGLAASHGHDPQLDPRRRVRSETASPLLDNDRSPATQHLQHLQLPPLDLSNVAFPAYRANFDMFGAQLSSSAEPDAPLFSAGLSETPVDWSNYEFAPHSSYSQAQSLSGVYDFCGSEQPTLTTTTTSTSGDVSEVDDFESASVAAAAVAAGASGFRHSPGYMGAGPGLGAAQRAAMMAGPGLEYDDLVKYKFRPGATDPTTATARSGLDSPTISGPTAPPAVTATSGGFSMVEDAIWMSTAYNDAGVDSPSSLPFDWS